MTEQQDQPQRPRPRIESLSDMVFGLALSVGAITLVSSPPLDAKSTYVDLGTFGFSFLILITIWLRYTRIMSVLPLASQRVVTLNTILLFLVSVEPFLFNIVKNIPAGVTDAAGYADATSTLYALDLGGMMVILAFFTFSAADEEKRLIPKDLVRQFRGETITWLVSGALYTVTALPIFFTVHLHGLPLRYSFWSVPTAFILAVRAYRRLSARRGEGPSGSAPA
ncbi:MAG: TMEM175 family protein [Nitrososphaerales archaeon]